MECIHITCFHLYHVRCPVGHRTCDVVMRYRSYILTYHYSSQYTVSRVEREVDRIVLSDLCTCDRTYTFFFYRVAVEHVVLICGSVVDVNTNTTVYNRVGQPHAFLLGQHWPLPLRCILSIVLLIRLRNNYTDLVILIRLEDKLILTCLRGLKSYIYLTLQPPTGAVAVYHRSFFYVSVPGSVGTQDLNNLEAVQTICLQCKSYMECIHIACFHLYHVRCPIGHCTGDVVMRNRNTKFNTVELESSICSSRGINVILLEHHFLRRIQIFITFQNLVNNKITCHFNCRSGLIYDNKILVVILWTTLTNYLTIVIECNFDILFSCNDKRSATGTLCAV